MADAENGSPAPKPGEAPKPKSETSEPAAPKNRGNRALVGVLVIVGAVALALVASRYFGEAGKIGQSIVKTTKSTGAASIGGPFTLTDHNGKRVSDKDFAGKYLLVYFGYTYCPDVCPTGLTVISDALDQLGADAAKVQPLFVTIDPHRDTPEQMKEYATYFHPSLIGLTGSDSEIAQVAKAYRIYYAKVENKDPDSDPEDYTVDHSAVTYLMGPKGGFLQHFSHSTDPETMARRIREAIKS